MEGDHLKDKSNRDVFGISFESQPMESLVSGGRKFFSKVEHLEVSKAGLKVIRRSDFLSWFELKTLILSKNEIVRLSDDTFIDLYQLDYLSLAHNKIASLSTNTFRFLGMLQTIHLYDNQLNRFPNLFYNLKLKDVHLDMHYLAFKMRSNECSFKKIYNEDVDAVQRALKAASDNCQSACKSIIKEANECHDRNYDLVKYNEDLDKQISLTRKAIYDMRRF